MPNKDNIRTKRKRIQDRRSLLDLSEIAHHGRLVPAWLENMKLVLADFDKPEYFDARIEVESNYDGQDDFYIISFRDETDKEMEKRLLREKTKREHTKAYRAKIAEKNKVEELAELERLKKKYETNNQKESWSSNGEPDQPL